MTQEQIKKLEELKKLLDAGILTQEEFDNGKMTILEKSEAEQKPSFQKSRLTHKTALYVLASIVLLVVIGGSIHKQSMGSDEAKEYEYDTLEEVSEGQEELNDVPEKILGFHIDQKWDDAYNLAKSLSKEMFVSEDSCEFIIPEQKYRGVLFDELHITTDDFFVNSIGFNISVKDCSSRDSMFDLLVNKLARAYFNVREINDDIYVAEGYYYIYVIRSPKNEGAPYKLEVVFKSYDDSYNFEKLLRED